MNQTFNPFKKPFDEIKEEDLECLKEVSEGWYIEYKQDKSDGKTIAKVIASFANSYGGLLFLGIEQNKKDNTCKSIAGVDAAPDYIRDCLTNNIQPLPYFETHKIRLANGKHIIMVVVPEGTEPPYIHSSGKIYKRQDSASDPIKKENNRFAVDELYKKAQKYQKEVNDFREIDFSFAVSEDEQPFLELFANIHPFQSFAIKELTFFEDTDFIEILNSFNEEYEIREEGLPEKFSIKGNLNFDSISSYDQKVALTTTKSCDLALNQFAMELDTFGNLRAVFPIPLIKNSNRSLNKEYSQIIRDSKVQNFDLIRLLNGRELFSISCGLTFQYLKFLQLKGFKDIVEIKFKLINCWRTSIYFDSNIYFEHIKKFGIPICRKDEQTFPNYPGIITTDKALKAPITSLGKLFAMVIHALGVPHPIGFKALLQEGNALKTS